MSIANIMTGYDIEETEEKIKAPVKLKGTIYTNKAIYCEDEESVIEIDGSIEISTEVPIVVASSKVTVKITGNGILKLNAGYQQPCIGATTNTGISYGRWSMSSGGVFKRLIVDDGVMLVCNSKVPNFSIGIYNREEVPEIIGKHITAPEVTGERILANPAMAPDGSTKMYAVPKYIIKTEGMTDEDLMSDELKELRDKLPEEVRKYIDYECLEVRVKTLVKHYEQGVPTRILEKIAERIKIKNFVIAEGLGFIQFPDTCYFPEEYAYEGLKLQYINEHFFKNFDEIKDTYKYYNDYCCACLIRYILDNTHKDFTRNEVVYNLVSSYSHRWEHDLSHLENAKLYLKEVFDNQHMEYELRFLDIDAIRKHFDYLNWR